MDRIQEIMKVHLTPGDNASDGNPGEGGRGEAGEGWNSARVRNLRGHPDEKYNAPRWVMAFYFEVLISTCVVPSVACLLYCIVFEADGEGGICVFPCD